MWSTDEESDRPDKKTVTVARENMWIYVNASSGFKCRVYSWEMMYKSASDILQNKCQEASILI
jgi:hypothetical protein